MTLDIFRIAVGLTVLGAVAIFAPPKIAALAACGIIGVTKHNDRSIKYIEVSFRPFRVTIKYDD